MDQVSAAAPPILRSLSITCVLARDVPQRCQPLPYALEAARLLAALLLAWLVSGSLATGLAFSDALLN